MSIESAPDSPQTVAKSSFAFLSGSVFSRLSGLGRDTAMAFAFGSNPAIAAFMVAFRFANLIRRLFGEGPLSAGFIPHFEELRSQSPQRGAQFFRDLFFSLAFFLMVLIGGIEVVLFCILSWGNLAPDNAQILYLTMLMMPGILFICLFGLSGGFLQCEGRYFMTGFAPVAFNVVWIAVVFLLKDQDPTLAVFPLSLSIVIAFLLQWAMIAPLTFSFLKRHLSWDEVLSPRVFSPELRRVFKPFLLGIMGVGAVQINSALDAIFARYASLEGPAYLWYAIRIEQVPLALFGIALSAALLPPLSRAIKEGNSGNYLKLLRFSLSRSFSLIFPCTVGIFVLGVSGVNLLYGHGDFTVEATYQTVLCLWGYGLGLLPAGFVLLLAPALYANKEYRIPTIGSIASVVLNICLTALFVFGFGWGAFSIAVATSVCAWFNYFYLSYHLTKKIKQSPLNREVIVSFAKTGICTLVAGAVTLLFAQLFVGDSTLGIAVKSGEVFFDRQFSVQLMRFLSLSGTFVLIFFSYAWMVNAEDVLELISLRQKRTSSS